jgi:acetate kinase
MRLRCGCAWNSDASDWGVSSRPRKSGDRVQGRLRWQTEQHSIVDEELLTAMENLSDIAPAHNPPYAKAMRQLRQAFPQIPLVAALETAFHETIPPEIRSYAIPHQPSAATLRASLDRAVAEMLCVAP